MLYMCSQTVTILPNKTEKSKQNKKLQGPHPLFPIWWDKACGLARGPTFWIYLTVFSVNQKVVLKAHLDSDWGARHKCCWECHVTSDQQAHYVRLSLHEHSVTLGVITWIRWELPAVAFLEHYSSTFITSKSSLASYTCTHRTHEYPVPWHPAPNGSGIP